MPDSRCLRRAVVLLSLSTTFLPPLALSQTSLPASRPSPLAQAARNLPPAPRHLEVEVRGVATPAAPPPAPQPGAAHGRTHYVAPHGSDANPGSQDAPFQTIARGLSVLQAGDTLYLRGGTYHESISTNHRGLASGTSWSQAITIAGHPGETVTIHPTESSVLILNAYQNPHTPSLRYLIFDNLILDAAGAEGVIGVYGAAEAIRVQNSEVKNARASGIHGGSGARAIEFVNLRVHHNGSSWLDHGFYLAIPDALIEGSEIYSNSGYGVQLYDSSCHGQGQCTTRAIVRRNMIRDNVTGGATLSDGHGVQFCHNVVTRNPTGVDLAYALTQAQVLSNTITEQRGAGIQVMAGSIGAVLQGNRFSGNAQDIVDQGSGTQVQGSEGGAAGTCADLPVPALAAAP